MEPSFYTLPSGRSYGKFFIEMCIKRDANWLTESDSDYPYNETPIHYACRTSQKEATLFFLSKLNDSYLKNPQTNDNGQSIVHLVCEWGDIEVISETMSNFGSSYKAVNSVDKNGMTPLAILVKKANKIGIAVFQLTRKVPMLPLNLTNSCDPFVIAQASNDPIILRLLLGSKPVNITQCTKLQRVATENETILFKTYFNEDELIENRYIAAIKLNDPELLHLLFQIKKIHPTPKMILAAKECSDPTTIKVLNELYLSMKLATDELYIKEEELEKVCEDEQPDTSPFDNFDFASLKDDFEKLRAKEELEKYKKRHSSPPAIPLKTPSTDEDESVESSVEDGDISSYTEEDIKRLNELTYEKFLKEFDEYKKELEKWYQTDKLGTLPKTPKEPIFLKLPTNNLETSTNEHIASEDEETKSEESTEIEPRASSCAVAADESEELDSSSDECSDVESVDELDELSRDGVSFPLHTAAKSGNLKELEQLLFLKKWNVNQHNEEGKTPLFCLCQSKSILNEDITSFERVMQLFIDSQVNVDEKQNRKTAFGMFFEMFWTRFIRSFSFSGINTLAGLTMSESKQKKACKLSGEPSGKKNSKPMLNAF